MTGFMIGMIVCLVLFNTSENVFILAIGLLLMVGHGISCWFNRCPHCGHNLCRHHIFIKYCPYCGEYL